MKRFIVAGCALLLSGSLLGCGGGVDGDVSPSLNDNDQKISYSIGYQIGTSFHDQELADIIDMNDLLAGMQDGMNEDDPALADSTRNRIMTEFQQQQQARQMKKFNEEKDKNQKEGEAFLEENATKKGVKTTESGLQYRVLEEGSGKSPDENDEVTVHYEGTLINGEVFDSSYERGEPTSFPVNRVIPGWTEALQMMKEGGKWEIYIPSDLAYGQQGAGQKIGPNSTLIFTVELLEVNEKS
jgi:FKBP-type peptidyl-prolyl cis-trans isomerase